MKRLRASVLLFLPLVLCGAVHGDEAFTTRHKCTDLKGNFLWEAAVTITPSDGDPYTYILVEKGKGRFSGYKGESSRKSEMRFISKSGSIRPLGMKSEVFSPEGRLIAETKQEFDPSGASVACCARDLVKGTCRTRSFKLKGDTINRLLTGLYTRQMIEEGGKEKTVNMLSEEPALYRVTLRVTGKETIEVNGRQREAFKVCIDPNIGLLTPVKVFLPKNYTWFSCEPPYEWLKFVGLEESIDSPMVEITTLDN